jgi:GNAT superfamily N-acetyltransferase
MADTINITPVSSRKDRREFMALLWQLYRDDPNWVPPLRGNQEELVGFKKHPFHDDAEVRCFVARKNGTVCGRIVAIVNHAHNRRYEEKRGFFGFFESIDDQTVASGLFKAAEDWLREKGMTDIRGPVNPSLNYEVGLLIEGFDSPPTFMMTYNPAYYERLIQTCGYEKIEDLFAFDADVSMLPTLDPKLQFVVEEVKRRFRINVRPMNPKKFAEEVNLFLEVYNKSLVGTWGFVPLSPGEVKHMSVSLRHLLVPELTTIVEVDGKPVGAGLGLLDFNPLIKQINGRLFPFGFLKLLFGKRSLKRMRLMSTNVLPEWQKWGLGLVALERMQPAALEFGITHGEFSWVLESNHLSRKTLERGGARRAKTYRIYDKKLSS